MHLTIDWPSFGHKNDKIKVIYFVFNLDILFFQKFRYKLIMFEISIFNAFYFVFCVFTFMISVINFNPVKGLYNKIVLYDVV